MCALSLPQLLLHTLSLYILFRWTLQLFSPSGHIHFLPLNQPPILTKPLGGYYRAEVASFRYVGWTWPTTGCQPTYKLHVISFLWEIRDDTEKPAGKLFQGNPRIVHLLICGYQQEGMAFILQCPRLRSKTILRYWTALFCFHIRDCKHWHLRQNKSE